MLSNNLKAFVEAIEQYQSAKANGEDTFSAEVALDQSFGKAIDDYVTGGRPGR
jgi:hypothetical protein